MVTTNDSEEIDSEVLQPDIERSPPRWQNLALAELGRSSNAFISHADFRVALRKPFSETDFSWNHSVLSLICPELSIG